MAINSTGWIVLIAVGAVIVAIGNIQFQRARDFEKSASAADQAKVLLGKELELNLAQVTSMRAGTASGKQVDAIGLYESAWRVVSSSGLLVNLDHADRDDVMEVYYLVDKANALNTRIVDLTLGTAATLSNSPQTKQKLEKVLDSILSKIEIKLNQLKSRNFF